MFNLFPSILFWLFCFYLNKNGLIIPKIGGGCFSKKTPQFSAPKLPTAEEIYQQATTRAKTETPLAYGAREAGLSDLARGTPFFESFQPTSIEQALSNQYFQNIM